MLVPDRDDDRYQKRFDSVVRNIAKLGSVAVSTKAPDAPWFTCREILPLTDPSSDPDFHWIDTRCGNLVWYLCDAQVTRVLFLVPRVGYAITTILKRFVRS